MHLNAKKIAVGGLMLAITEVCITLGSVIETNTLFLLAAASFFVGIVIRETSPASGGAFLLAGILLGVFIAPNKLYVVSYAAMGCYILASEVIWRILGRISWTDGKRMPKQQEEAAFVHAGRIRRIVFRTAKCLVFNLMYIPMLFAFQNLLFGRELPAVMLALAIAAGQIGLLLYDRAYEYVQAKIWSPMRGRLL